MGRQGRKDLRDVAAVCIIGEVTIVILLSAAVVVLSTGRQEGSSSHLVAGAIVDGRVDGGSLNRVMLGQLVENILDSAANRDGQAVVDLEVEDLVSDGVGNVVVTGDGLQVGVVVRAWGLCSISLSVSVLSPLWLKCLGLKRRRQERKKRGALTAATSSIPMRADRERLKKFIVVVRLQERL